MPAPSPKKISDFKPLLTNLAQTAQYEVTFSGLAKGLKDYLYARGIFQFNYSEIGLLCHSASLPGSSFATADVYGDYMGLTESIAHTRTFIPIDLSFYVDKSYNSIKFFEHWMEYMHDASSASRLQPRPHFRMKYQSEYKCDSTKIVKFERDYNRYIEYNFYGLYPKTMNATAVSYEKSDLLKIGVTFSYDYYVSGKVDSKSVSNGTSNNLYEQATNDIDLINLSNQVWGSNGTQPSSLDYSTNAFGDKAYINPNTYSSAFSDSTTYSIETTYDSGFTIFK